MRRRSAGKSNSKNKNPRSTNQGNSNSETQHNHELQHEETQPMTPNHQHQNSNKTSSTSFYEVLISLFSGLRRNQSRSKRKSKKMRSRAVFWMNSSTWYASAVLVVAMGGSWYWNQVHNVVDPAVVKLLQLVMASSSGEALFSHPDLTPTRRTLTAMREIPQRTVVLRMPRSHLIWDLDALRDSFVQRELFSARTMKGKPLAADVFLAAHLARLLLKHNAGPEASKSLGERDQVDGLDPISAVLQQYLKTLPTYEDYADFHPLLADLKPVAGALKVSSAAYDLIHSHRESMDESYEALCRVSSRFQDEVSRETFITASLHVWTRSFGTGPLLSLSATEEQEDSQLVRELEYYENVVGVDLRQGCHSMVPILDAYNHFGNPNVEYRYDFKSEAFVVTTTRALQMGQEVFDSYGKHSQAHLYAKYGFLNSQGDTGDSDYMQASLALHHPVYSHGMPLDIIGTKEGERMETTRLLRYLHYDDGYESCVTEPSEEDIDNKVESVTAAFSFKLLKLQHLVRIAKDSSRWMVFLAPRNPKAKPPLQLNHSSTESIRHRSIPRRLVPSQVQLNANPLMATCRLFVLTHHDYNGTARQMLRDALEDNEEPFEPPPPLQDEDDASNALQYRELMCLLRLSHRALQQYDSTTQEHADYMLSLKTTKREGHDSAIGSDNEWNLAYLKMVEMQALEVLQEVAAQWMRQFERQHEPDSGQPLLNSAPEYTVRGAPCPWDEQLGLLDYMDGLA